MQINTGPRPPSVSVDMSADFDSPLVPVSRLSAGWGGAGGALRQSYLALTLISLLPFVSHLGSGTVIVTLRLIRIIFCQNHSDLSMFLVCKLNMAGFGHHYYSCVAENVPTTIKTLFSWKCTPCLDSSC